MTSTTSAAPVIWPSAIAVLAHIARESLLRATDATTWTAGFSVCAYAFLSSPELLACFARTLRDEEDAASPDLFMRQVGNEMAGLIETLRPLWAREE